MSASVHVVLACWSTCSNCRIEHWFAATLSGTVVIGSTTPPKGNWQTTFDGVSQHINWAAISWTASVPQYTQLVMQMRVANSQGLLCGAFEIFNGSLCVSTATYTTLTNQRMISTHGQYMQVC